MSDCVCGARGIGLDGHECIPSLRARAEQAEKQLADLRELFNYQHNSIDALKAELAAKDAELTKLIIQRDKEFWKSYADETYKNLANSNSRLSAALYAEHQESEKLLAAKNAEIAKLNLRLNETYGEYQVAYRKEFGPYIEAEVEERFREGIAARDARIKELEEAFVAACLRVPTRK